MRILITGATGFIGHQLIKTLGKYHALCVLTRDKQRAEQRLGTTVDQFLTLDELDSLDGFEAIINLAGEPIAARRWSAAVRPGSAPRSPSISATRASACCC